MEPHLYNCTYEAGDYEDEVAKDLEKYMEDMPTFHIVESCVGAEKADGSYDIKFEECEAKGQMIVTVG